MLPMLYLISVLVHINLLCKYCSYNWSLLSWNAYCFSNNNWKPTIFCKRNSYITYEPPNMDTFGSESDRGKKYMESRLCWRIWDLCWHSIHKKPSFMICRVSMIYIYIVCMCLYIQIKGTTFYKGPRKSTIQLFPKCFTVVPIAS